jgi:hypothetical protein
MILRSAVQLYRPLAASPDAVTRAVADDLRDARCVIRRADAGVVEFDGPGGSAVVSGGAVWIDPAALDRRLRLSLRVSPRHLAWSMAAACAAAVFDISVITRALILAVIAAHFWISLDAARSPIEDAVKNAARRA